MVNCGVICLLIFDSIIQKKYTCEFDLHILIDYRSTLMNLLEKYETKKSKQDSRYNTIIFGFILILFLILLLIN